MIKLAAAKGVDIAPGEEVDQVDDVMTLQEGRLGGQRRQQLPKASRRMCLLLMAVSLLSQQLPSWREMPQTSGKAQFKAGRHYAQPDTAPLLG
jgi:hypothetical protein